VELIVTVHEPEPLHAPLHPLKFQPDKETAFKVTLVPLLYA
jgi:hypothetical protein